MDDRILVRMDAIISSMTKKERTKPELLQAKRKIRIANGSGTTVPEVSDRDRSLVAFCSGVFDFQKSGLKLLTTSSIDPSSVGVVAVDFRRKFELAALAAPGDIAAELGPMLSALQQAVLIADLNRALASADAALGRAFGAMSRVCPRQVPADTVDQYRTFQLGAPVPEEFVAAVFGIKPI
jgi:hypothetical protein